MVERHTRSIIANGSPSSLPTSARWAPIRAASSETTLNGNKFSDLQHSSSFLRVAMRFIPDNVSASPRFLPIYPETLDAGLNFLCSDLSRALYGQIHPGKFPKRKANGRPERQPWPSHLDDILPGGASTAEVLDSLLRWAREPGHGTAAFTVISALARFWEPFATELMNRPTAFLLAMRHLQHAADTFSPHAPDAWNWPCVVDKCAEFFMGMLLIEGRRLQCMLPGFIKNMDAICRRIEPLLTSMDGMETALELCDLVRFISTEMVASNCKFKLTPTATRKVEGGAQPSDAIEKLCLAAFSAIWELRNRNQCMQLGCTASMVKRSSVCARCGVVRYCSRECQRAAWKDHPNLPHKAICSQIRQLREVLQVSDVKTWDGLVLHPGIDRSAVALEEICKPYVDKTDSSIVFAIQDGLNRLIEAKLSVTLVIRSHR
ncbi:hypothetical protein C8R47DRAFT_1255068 [Mycena vitilis]|nr:hypothetical protein C8R47DRAFT_1255068 [Mycena vitilis]